MSLESKNILFCCKYFTKQLVQHHFFSHFETDIVFVSPVDGTKHSILCVIR